MLHCLNKCLLGKVEQIGDFHRDSAMGRAGEVILLRAVVEVREAEVITSFHQEVACPFSPEFHACAACDAVIE